jgi:hypothetical protein
MTDFNWKNAFHEGGIILNAEKTKCFSLVINLHELLQGNEDPCYLLESMLLRSSAKNAILATIKTLILKEESLEKISKILKKICRNFQTSMHEKKFKHSISTM